MHVHVCIYNYDYYCKNDALWQPHHFGASEIKYNKLNQIEPTPVSYNFKDNKYKREHLRRDSTKSSGTKTYDSNLGYIMPSYTGAYMSKLMDFYISL